MKTSPEIILHSDDSCVRAVRHRPSDGQGWLWDVEVRLEDGVVLTIGCENAAHARKLWGEMNKAAHFLLGKVPA
jgi:hypothetical protein